jgi:hypothetical protein
MRTCSVRRRQIALCEPPAVAGARAYALTADENGRFQQAAATYETYLATCPADLDATLNLAVLYWEVAQSGIRPVAGISADFVAGARKRLGELLDCAGEHFADSAELRFWSRHMCRSELGETPESSECRQLLRERPDYLEPACVVFSTSGGEDAEPEAMRLLAACAEQPTARSRHVITIINDVLRWRWA